MKKSTIRQNTTRFAVTLISLLILARISLPYAVQYNFTNWFEQHGVNARIDNVAFNLIDGNFSLQAIHGTKDSKQIWALQEVSVQWSWSELLDHHAHIFSIKLNGIDFDISQNASGNLIIAGIDISKLSTSSSNATVNKKTNDTPNNKLTDWVLQLDQLSLSNVNICYFNHAIKNMNYCSRINNAQWDGDIRIDLAQLSSTEVPLSSNGSFTLKAFNLHNNQLNRNLLTFKLLELQSVKLETLNNISVANFILNDITILQRMKDNNPPQLSHIDKLNIKQVAFTHLNKIHVREVIINNQQIAILVNKNKKLTLNKWIPKSLIKTDVTKKPTPSTTKKKPLTIIIDAFSYKTNLPTQYIDNSLAEPFKVTFTNMDLNITNLDSSKPDQASNIVYSAHYDKHGKINLKGKMNPFAKKPSFNIAGKISAIDLRSISALTKDTIGHSIKSGQLDADLTLIAKNSILDSQINLSLFQFDLKAISKDDAEKLNSGLGFPLNPTLLLLKDRDNSIHLTIPITGDLKNPDFEIHDVITTALTKGITAAILNFYTPYGIADSLINLATALRFEPVIFNAGSDQLTDEAVSNLTKIATLMAARPGIHITLCGHTNNADWLALSPKTSSKSESQTLKLSEKQKVALSELSSARYNMIKELLIADKIGASRLISCESEHDESGELSEVEISI